MSNSIKISHAGLSQEERASEMAKWIDHEAYPLFAAEKGNGRDPIATCARSLEVAAHGEAFPLWLRDNLMVLGYKGIGVSLELEDGKTLSNTDTMPGVKGRIFKAGRLTAG
jgi:hypothetical protein